MLEERSSTTRSSRPSSRDRRRFRVLTLIDLHSRECLALNAGFSLPAERVTAVLDRIIQKRGAPVALSPRAISKFVKAAGAVGLSNRGTDAGIGSVEPAQRASSGLVPEERRVPGGITSGCLRVEGPTTTEGISSSPARAGASGL